MKKIICLLLCAVMTISLAACGENTREAGKTAEPTLEPAVTAVPPEVTDAPTEEPTAAPTEAPTEAPTPEPTAVPEPEELDFDSCAELVLRLSWGNGDKQVFIRPLRHGDDDGDWEIPQHFNIIDGKVYIFDRFRPYGKGIIVCDPETGNIERLSPDIGDNNLECGEFAVMDGRLIFRDCMYDLSTGERTEIENALNRVLIMNVSGDKCLAFNAVNVADGGQEFLFTQATYAYDVYELDMENLTWVQRERIEMPEYVPHAEPPFSNYDIEERERSYLFLQEGEGIFSCFDRYMGTDGAGNHYIDSEEELIYRSETVIHSMTTWHRIIKYSPDGTPLSYVDVYFPDDYLYSDWGNYLIYKVDADGTVWYMCETEAEVLIYKINL